MKRRLLLTALPFIAAACATAPKPLPETDEAVRVIYLVRHAEKQVIEGERNPELSAAGFERAALLPAALEGRPIEAIYSSDYRRTQQTVAPIATERGLEIISYDPADAAALVRTLRKSSALQVLVSGHSNTLPALIAELGAPPPTIADDQYGDLFVVSIDGETVSLSRERYGDLDE